MIVEATRVFGAEPDAVAARAASVKTTVPAVEGPVFVMVMS